MKLIKKIKSSTLFQEKITPASSTVAEISMASFIVFLLAYLAHKLTGVSINIACGVLLGMWILKIFDIEKS